MTAPDVSDTKAAAVQLLYDNIAALPHDEYGVINMLPFAHDSEQVRILRRHVCEAVVNLFEQNNLIAHDQPDSEPTTASTVTIKCLNPACTSEMLIQMPVSNDGTAYVNAHMLIQQISALNPDCPHGVMGLEDMRRHMEQEFWADPKTQESLAHQDELDDPPNSQEGQDV